MKSMNHKQVLGGKSLKISMEDLHRTTAQVETKSGQPDNVLNSNAETQS